MTKVNPVIMSENTD